MPESRPKPSAVGRTLNQVECEYIAQVLTDVEGNRKAAARILGIAEKTLYQKILKYHIRVKFYCECPLNSKFP
jgi:DNA-binding NtrC family response regulator